MKDKLEEELKGLSEDIAKVEEAVLDDFARSGLQNLTLDGRTCYLHRQLWASPKDGDNARVVGALYACGMSDMVQERVNAQTLSAWFREQDRDGIAVPESLAAAVELTEKFSIRIRRNGHGE